MGTTKVGIYRQYYGPIPKDASGKALPRQLWPKKRGHSWLVRWTGLEGKRYSQSFKTFNEADRFAEEKQEEVRDGKSDPPPRISLEQFVKEHTKVMKGQVAHETLLDQLRALEMFKAHLKTKILLDDITPRNAESFIAARLASGVKIATVNKDIRTLKRIFNLAIEPRGYLREGSNPFARIKQRKQAPKAVRYVTTDDFQKLVAVTKTSWWKALLFLAYTTATRLGELLNLTWADVDFEKHRVRIVAKDVSDQLQGWEPKDHEGRVLPVPVEVMQLLANLQAELPEGSVYVFVPTERVKHIQRAIRAGTWKDESPLLNNLNRRLRVLIKRANIPPLTYHDLRRTCITNWARHLPIHVVRKLAGHSDLKTTQQYYLSVQEDDLEKARMVQSRILTPS